MNEYFLQVAINVIEMRKEFIELLNKLESLSVSDDEIISRILFMKEMALLKGKKEINAAIKLKTGQEVTDDDMINLKSGERSLPVAIATLERTYKTAIEKLSKDPEFHKKLKIVI